MKNAIYFIKDSTITSLYRKQGNTFFYTRYKVLCLQSTSVNCLVISSDRKIRATKTEFILCHQFSALKVSDITGNAAHRPEPHTTSANNCWKIKTLAFNCNGSSFQPLGWDSLRSLSANTAVSQSQH